MKIGNKIMKIDKFETNRQTDEHTLTLLELLTEPKNLVTYRSRRGLGAEPPSLTVLPSSFLLSGLIIDRGKKPPSSSAQ